MRITNEMTNRMLSSYILQNQEDCYNLQEQISSGKKFLHPSDNPSGFDVASRLHDEEKTTTQFIKNAEQLAVELKTADGKLQEVTEILQRASELIVSGSNGTQSPANLTSMGQEVNGLLEDLVRIANSNPQGQYIFSGLRTDTPAYAVTRDANDMITGITYQGSAETRQTEIDSGVYVQANIPGSDSTATQSVFQSSDVDLFEDLIHLRDRLFNGENLVEEQSFSADPATDTLTVTQSYATGSTVLLSTTDTLPGGLKADTTYYAIRFSDTEIRLASSLANARAGIAIDITDAGSGTQSITQTALAENTRDLDHILQVITSIGAREERVDLTNKAQAARQVNIGQSLENVESIDVASAATELSSRKLAYEATLKVTAALMDTSLLNYI
jgi:flagellar hook-associated protein 3 FlgL